MLKIGNPVQPKYRNKYVISTKCMHGDADVYTHQEADLEDAVKAERGLILVEQSRDRKRPKLTDEDEELYEYVMTLVPYDVTNDNVRARLMWVKINYYDEDGKIFEVKMVNNE
jgi:hypothetical protein